MKIEIKGAIVSDSEQWIYDYFEIPATSPQKVNKALNEANGADIEVIINSGGGSVHSGSEIYTNLKDYKGKTTGKIVGIAGSSASVISMGIDKLLISPTAQIMIHRASMVAAGNNEDFNKASEILSQIDKSIANSYILKTGLSQKELLNLMSKETWLTAQEAKEKGFVDGIMFAEENNNFVNSVETDKNGLLPKSVIDKMRNELQNKSTEDFKKDKQTEDIQVDNDNKNEIELMKAKLKLQLEL
ncbi:MAG: Clp protease ClpP [Firmicutes bacterium]|nr:Clp protease ClpP [Bacillota bacterium]